MAEREGFAHSLANSRWLLRRLPYAHCREPLGSLFCRWQRLLRFESLGSVTSKLTWRRGRDSNPRYLSVHTISNRAPSAARSPLRRTGKIHQRTFDCKGFFSVSACRNRVGQAPRKYDPPGASPMLLKSRFARCGGPLVDLNDRTILDLKQKKGLVSFADEVESRGAGYPGEGLQL